MHADTASNYDLALSALDLNLDIRWAKRYGTKKNEYPKQILSNPYEEKLMIIGTTINQPSNA